MEKRFKAAFQSLMDSFCRKLSDPSIGLTPKELLVADMVKQGKSSTEIAKLLNLTLRTIEVYRNIIRNKLKISGKKINLHSYLKGNFP
jgi:DNA-binding CsgD family transcriptional regulator